MLSVIGRLQLDRWDVAAVFVEAVVVEPVDPLRGGQFDVVDGAPGLAWSDQLGHVQTGDRLGERIDAPISVKRRAFRLVEWCVVDA